MKFDQRTIQILKNFSTINPSLIFREGSTLMTISPTSTVMAKAQIPDVIPKDFAIAELSRFLGVLSLFDQPDLDIGDTSLTISSKNQKVRYVFADPRSFVTPSNAKGISMPDTEINFELKLEDLQSLIRTASALGLPHIAVTGKDGQMNLEAINVSNKNSDTFNIFLKATDLDFRMVFKIENLKLMNFDYNVSISSKGIAQFTSNTVTYWVATDAVSTYNT